jgi:ABC-type multidrug transport system ATPase subunit
MLEARLLWKFYGGTAAVRDVSFVVGAGEIVEQKVLLIAALMHDPEVLVLDEPESGLDVTAALVLRHS